MPKRTFAFFQHWPPYSGAASLRGRSILLGLRDRDEAGETSLHVRTTTPDPTVFDRIEVQTLPVGELENSEGMVKRILGELRIGWIASREILGKGGGCDLLIISMPAYLAGIVLSFRARMKKVPYVLEVRDVYPQVYAGAGLIKTGSLIYRFFAGLSRRAYENAAAVVVATQGLERVVRGDAPNANTHCVYNGFPDAFLTRNAEKHERFTVCFHGVMGFFQDIETLIAVARELEPHDVDVVVIGYGRQESLLREKVPGNLDFRGRMPFEQTIETIERCHLGLCLRKDDPISRDAFPVKTWEYLGLGMPSIVTPHCEAGAFLEERGCGLQLDSGDVAGIVEQVLALKADREALAALATRCREVGPGYTRRRLGAEAAAIFANATRG